MRAHFGQVADIAGVIALTILISDRRIAIASAFRKEKAARSNASRIEILFLRPPPI